MENLRLDDLATDPAYVKFRKDAGIAVSKRFELSCKSLQRDFTRLGD
jgi:hypothetical protein